jgi:hypothetical protein
MFTSLFGKRDREPEPKETEAQSNQEPERRGFLDRMREAVTRTRQSLSDSISGVIALTREIDETSLDELEFALLPRTSARRQRMRSSRDCGIARFVMGLPMEPSSRLR